MNKASFLSTLATFGKVLGLAIVIFVAGSLPWLFFPSKYGSFGFDGWLGFAFVLYGTCVVMPIWVGLIFGVFYFRKRKRFRTMCCLVPLAALICFNLFDHYKPPNPHRLFEGFTNTELPENAKSFQWDYYRRGGFDYFHDLTLYFETSPAEVDRLIREMDLTFIMSKSEWASDLQDRDREFPVSPYEFTSNLGDGPNIREWKGAVKYGKQHQGAGDFHKQSDLITNQSKTKVYIDIGVMW